MSCFDDFDVCKNHMIRLHSCTRCLMAEGLQEPGACRGFLKECRFPPTARMQADNVHLHTLWGYWTVCNPYLTGCHRRHQNPLFTLLMPYVQVHKESAQMKYTKQPFVLFKTVWIFLSLNNPTSSVKMTYAFCVAFQIKMIGAPEQCCRKACATLWVGVAAISRLPLSITQEQSPITAYLLFTECFMLPCNAKCSESAWKRCNRPTSEQNQCITITTVLYISFQSITKELKGC